MILEHARIIIHQPDISEHLSQWFMFMVYVPDKMVYVTGKIY